MKPKLWIALILLSALTLTKGFAALTQWVPIANRSGTDQVSPAAQVPGGTNEIYAQLDVPAGGSFNTDTTQHIYFEIQWSSAAFPQPSISFHHATSGTLDGGPAESKNGQKSSGWAPFSSCTAIRVLYSIINGPIQFGVQGELR